MPDNPENTPPPGDPGREPLDTWLSQQIQPLPPPPGTFDLITRRARRRRLRRAAVTAVSGAVVAAGALIVTTNPTLLRLIPPSESGQTVAGARAQSPVSPSAGTHQQNGSARLEPSPPAPSPPADVHRPFPGPVPPDFAPSSVTFVSASRAWVIGQAGVPGSCYNGNICTSVAWTSDDGGTWHGEHAPVAGAPSGANGVSGIRFLDGTNGWAFGPELWATHDGGSSWHAVDTSGQRVTDLEAAGNRAYALFADCSGTDASGFAAGCTSYTLMTATAGSDDWVPAGSATSDLSTGGAAAGSAALVLTGGAGYLLAPDGSVYSGPIGGAWARAGTAPCQPGPAQASGLPADALLAATSTGHLALACAGSSSGTQVSVSDDGGATWTGSQATAPGGTPPVSGPASPSASASASAPADLSATGTPMSLAAAPGGTLVLATTNGIYVLPSGASQWQPATGAGGSSLPDGGFSYAGMTTGSQGVALPANTSLHEVWVTSDGGRTWSARPVR